MTSDSFLTLPAEIRTSIYHLLLTPNTQGDIISIRTESPEQFKARKNTYPNQLRSRYRAIHDRIHPSSFETSYTGKASFDIHVTILRVCRQIHSEACHILYSENTFDFDMDIESMVPFLRDRTPLALASVRSVRFTKRCLPYCSDFDHCEWRNACDFLSTQMKLQRLTLRVVGADFSPSVREGLLVRREPPKPWSMEDFGHVMQSERMEWARQLCDIKGLRTLEVVATLMHCPPPRSENMAFFATFSASIEIGFAPYLKRILLDQSTQ